MNARKIDRRPPTQTGEEKTDIQKIIEYQEHMREEINFIFSQIYKQLDQISALDGERSEQVSAQIVQINKTLGEIDEHLGVIDGEIEDIYERLENGGT